ncbi:phenylalanine--tRNA ligase subunit beta [soil metagenome]
MNISYRWLQSLAPSITDSPAELAQRLAMLGAPVDEIVELGAQITDIVIARVTEVLQHPNADRLRLCTVDAGSGAALQVVCGAPNVEAGQFYPFAPVGASLPGGVSIRKAKLRGEVSEGMLCSARELGLGRDQAGLMTLHGEWEPGARFVDSLGLDDARLDVDITANRPDLLSHVGIARELAVSGVAGIDLPEFPTATGASLEIRGAGAAGECGGVEVRIEDVEGCPRYTGAVVRGVRVGPSPEWLAGRLRAVGVRPINNVVDATNYVLFELGQPLHAFDLARLGPEVRIRRARGGEMIRTLDGVDRTLDAQMLVIADAERPVAVAGVMGGEDAEVCAATTNLFLECALFEPRSVRKTARQLGLSTDASYRFERGVDPECVPLALRRVVELILAVAGGEIDGEALDLNPAPFTRPMLTLRPERVEKLLGVSISAREVESLLGAIGFDVDGAATPLRVGVPGFRPDVTREVDLIEEIARRRGYDAFPEELLPFRPSIVPENPMAPVARRLRDRFRALGFLEARVASFAPAATRRVALLNPLSAEESHLRDSLVPGLLRRVEHNWARGTRDLRLFELGTVFFPGTDGDVVSEEFRFAAVFTGARRPPHWTETAPVFDVWDLKSVLSELAAELGAEEVEPGHPEVLDGVVEPGTGLEARMGEEVAGGGGRARAAVMDAPAWAAPVWVIEVRVPSTAAEPPVPRYQPLPEHPAAERDLALLVPLDVSAADLDLVIRESAGALLESVRPFDLYEGEGVPEGVRSVAWRVRFRAADRTLTDAEVDRAVTASLAALEERLGVRRR